MYQAFIVHVAYVAYIVSSLLHPHYIPNQTFSGFQYIVSSIGQMIDSAGFLRAAPFDHQQMMNRMMMIFDKEYEKNASNFHEKILSKFKFWNFHSRIRVGIYRQYIGAGCTRSDNF